MSNFDITELLTDGRTDRQTNGNAGTSVAKLGGQGDVSCKVCELCCLLTTLVVHYFL